MRLSRSPHALETYYLSLAQFDPEYAETILPFIFGNQKISRFKLTL